jgi:hypothetical protein
MHLIRYCMADGLDWDAARLEDDGDRRMIDQALRTHNLLDIPARQNEVVRVLRGVSSLSRTPTNGLQFADGRDLSFCFLLEFAEHLAPNSQAGGGQTDTQLLISALRLFRPLRNRNNSNSCSIWELPLDNTKRRWSSTVESRRLSETASARSATGRVAMSVLPLPLRS